jgi:hypothetical protein
MQTLVEKLTINDSWAPHELHAMVAGDNFHATKVLECIPMVATNQHGIYVPEPLCESVKSISIALSDDQETVSMHHGIAPLQHGQC